MKPGVYDMSNADYHADRTAISKSGLDLINDCPARFRWRRDHPKAPTPSMEKGTLVHLIALEPESFDEYYYVGEKPEASKRNAYVELQEPHAVLPPTIKQRRGKAYEDFCASHPGVKVVTQTQANSAEEYSKHLKLVNGRELISEERHTEATKIAWAVKSNPVARAIIANAKIEKSVVWKDFETGVLCKCRPDILIGRQEPGNGHVKIYDLKTVQNAQGVSVAHSCRKYRYDVQAAFYLDGCRWIGAESFGFIAVDTTDEPYQCSVFHRLDDSSLAEGRRAYRADLRTYAYCLERDEWPGYPEEYDMINTLRGIAW